MVSMETAGTVDHFILSEEQREMSRETRLFLRIELL